MQSPATTVDAYLASLPDDRRAAISAVRKVILDNLDPAFEEGISYGMIGYCLPHKLYPSGYHCDPKQPLPYAGLASRKDSMSLYMMFLYIGEQGSGPGGESDWFETEWRKTGKKLDMGKACVRFKKVEDIPLELIAEAFRRVPAKTFVATYDNVMAKQAASKAARKVSKKAPSKKA